MKNWKVVFPSIGKEFNSISGLRLSLNEVFALLLCYAALICSWFPTFQDNLSLPHSKVKQSMTSLLVWPLPST